MRFRARETFEASNGSTYVEGMIYTVRPGNDALATLVDAWLAEGKVERVLDATAVVTGSDKGLLARLWGKIWP